MVNPRFSQLLDLARNGDEASVAQLWHEFGFDFHAECPPVDPVSSVSSVVDSPIRVNSCSSVVKPEVSAVVPKIINHQSSLSNAALPQGGLSC